MANRNTKHKRLLAAKELAAKKKSNPDFRQSNPPRLTKPRDISKWKNAPGYRKDNRRDDTTAKGPKIYKAELAEV